MQKTTAGPDGKFLAVPELSERNGKFRLAKLNSSGQTAPVFAPPELTGKNRSF